MSAFDIFRCRKSLISSQLFCAINALVIKVLTNPLNFACANLVLLLPVNSEAVSISINQSSSCEESCPFNMGIFCNKELTRDVFFCAVHKVSVYLSNTFSTGVFWWCNASVNLSRLCSKSCMAFLGSLCLSSTNCFILAVFQINHLIRSSS